MLTPFRIYIIPPSLAIPLAQMGATVSASDISSSMSTEASRRASSLGVTTANFYTSDLESVEGNYDTVTCVDVAIHYPTEQMEGMIGHLCGLADRRVIFR
jgi:magnesium-protoporphyrin O-methyltransferase